MSGQEGTPNGVDRLARIERPDACPREGQIEPFDAGWHAHEVGLARETVRVFSADPGWALLGWDARQAALARLDSGAGSD